MKLGIVLEVVEVEKVLEALQYAISYLRDDGLEGKDEQKLASLLSIKQQIENFYIIGKEYDNILIPLSFEDTTRLSTTLALIHNTKGNIYGKYLISAIGKIDNEIKYRKQLNDSSNIT